MKNILVVGDFLYGSGLTRFILDTFSKIDKSKIKIDVLNISGSHEMDEEIREIGWNMYYIFPANQGLKKHLKEFKLFLKSYGHKYDAIHFNYSALWNFMPILYAKKYNVKNIVMHSHNTYFSNVSSKKYVMFVLNILHKIGRKIVEKSCSGFFACSEDAAEWFYSKRIIKSSRMKIIKNGINLGNYSFDQKTRDYMRSEMNLEGKFVVGHIGVLESRKNQEFLIKIFKEVLDKRENAVLLLIGEGSLKSKYKELVKSLGIEKSVFFLGIRNDIEKLLQVMDVFVFPSVTEGFGIALVEAQASGLICLSSKNVPKEAFCTDLVYPISLRYPSKWVEQILKIPGDYDRHLNKNEINLRVYDINKTARDIEDFYLALN